MLVTMDDRMKRRIKREGSNKLIYKVEDKHKHSSRSKTLGNKVLSRSERAKEETMKTSHR